MGNGAPLNLKFFALNSVLVEQKIYAHTPTLSPPDRGDKQGPRGVRHCLRPGHQTSKNFSVFKLERFNLIIKRV